MIARQSVRLLGLALAAAAAGCLPPSEPNDPIAETRRMMREAESSGRSGQSGNNVFISIERLSVAAEDAAGLAALWRCADGRVTVTGGGLAGAGVRLGAAGDGFQAQVAAWQSRTRGAERSTLTIQVMPGAEGYLCVAQRALVPVLRIRTAAGEAVVLENALVGAELAVRPKILANGDIELDLRPCFNVLAGPRGGQRLVAESLSSRVVLTPGRKLVLGSAGSAAADSVAGALFGYSASGKQAATLVTVSAERL